MCAKVKNIKIQNENEKIYLCFDIFIIFLIVVIIVINEKLFVKNRNHWILVACEGNCFLLVLRRENEKEHGKTRKFSNKQTQIFASLFNVILSNFLCYLSTSVHGRRKLQFQFQTLAKPKFSSTIQLYLIYPYLQTVDIFVVK